MAQVVITINDREYPIACENGQEVRIMQLAQILEQKAQMLKGFSGQISENMFLAMIGILVADDLMEARKNLNASAEENHNDKIWAEKIKIMDEKIKNIAKQIETL
ncbi:MAG: cell division protein ZapA [Alphaproteobacteria bacterium]|nr:cell division protein ZapA [Alphaproteobacteria bacterium]